MLGGERAREVAGHTLDEGRLGMRRPMFAGAVTATVTLAGHPQIGTIRASAYEPPQSGEAAMEITTIHIDESTLPDIGSTPD